MENQIRLALKNGLSREQERVINLLVGITMASQLDSEEKTNCIKFLRDVEMYIDFEGEV